MRKLILTFVLAAAAIAADKAEAVRNISSQWRAAVIMQDKEALVKLLADDMLYSHANGSTQTKSEYLAAVTKPPARYESFTDSETNIKVYGNTAVLAGFVDVKLVGREPYRVRTLEVYVLNKGIWQMTAHQSARISK